MGLEMTWNNTYLLAQILANYPFLIAFTIPYYWR